MSDSYSAGKYADAVVKQWESKCKESADGNHRWERDDWNPDRHECKHCHEVLFSR